MPIRQVYAPNLGQKAVRGWCLKFVDDAGKVKNTAPPRKPNARAALDAEIAAKRLTTAALPVDVTVVGFLDLRAGQWAKDDHVFFIRKNKDGSVTIHDSETNAGARKPYKSIAELMAWFGAYNPIYVGWSTHCDSRQYAEYYEDKPKATFTRVARKGTFKVTATAIKVRSTPNPKKGDTGNVYKKGMKFNYDSYTIANGYVWLSYISNSGARRYVAEGPYDRNHKNVWGTGGV